MRTLGFAYLGPTAPFKLTHVVSTGQSLSVGYESVVHDTTQPFSNLMLHDSANVYDITNPTAGTLSLLPLVSLQRPAGLTEYPTNLQGDSVDISFVNAVVSLTPGSGYIFASSAVGAGGQAMADIEKGGTGPAYAAGLYECRAFKNLNGSATFGVACTLLTHGEADALVSSDPTVYEALVVTLQANYETDLKGITGQTSSIPMLVTQQTTFPHGFQGENSTALAVWLAAVANPKIVLVGPKYQFTYSSDTRVHMPDYRPVGELNAKVYASMLEGSAWIPLWPTAFARVGTTVTVTFNVPSPPLVFDGVESPPHGGGTPWSMWGPGNGFEAYDQPLTIDSASNASPIVCHSTTPHGLSSGALYALQNAAGNTNVNGVWTITSTGANTFSLNGSTGNGTLSAPIKGFSPIGITGVVISGNQVTITLARTPVGGTGVIAYAHHADQSWVTGNTYGTGGFPDGRCGLLRDSDPFVGPITGTALPNWCIEFAQAVA